VTPDVLWNAVQAYPETSFILAHWGGGYPFYELIPEVKAASQHVYYDSGASTYLYSPQIFRHVGQIVGFNKVLWGSDYPVLRQKRFIQKVRELPLEESEKDAVLGGNAVRLLGLGRWKKSEATEAAAFRSWAF
jgi:predicted TIM-barrel fold metal-dependent hydrolase